MHNFYGTSTAAIHGAVMSTRKDINICKVQLKYMELSLKGNNEQLTYIKRHSTYMDRDHSRSRSSQHFEHAQNFRQIPWNSNILWRTRNSLQSISKDEKQIAPEKRRIYLFNICFINPVMCDSDFEREILSVIGLKSQLVGHVFVYLCSLALSTSYMSVLVRCRLCLRFFSYMPCHVCCHFCSFNFRDPLRVCFSLFLIRCYLLNELCIIILQLRVSRGIYTFSQQITTYTNR